MKITKHISFFYLENRICYINNIINETNNYEYETDIFIHTNNEKLIIGLLNHYTNGILNIIYHDLSNIHPYYLTWKCRELLKAQKNDYDIFIYTEDDMLIPFEAIKYWLTYNTKLIEMNYNLGFLRIEVKDNVEFITDLYNTYIDTYITLNDEKYCINNKNPYCAFWIYNKDEFNNFVNSRYYDINNIPVYQIREKSAIGLHGESNYWYKNTVIPIINDNLIPSCKIYHMPNNYVNDPNTLFGKIEFNKALS